MNHLVPHFRFFLEETGGVPSSARSLLFSSWRTIRQKIIGGGAAERERGGSESMSAVNNKQPTDRGAGGGGGGGYSIGEMCSISCMAVVV